MSERDAMEGVPEPRVSEFEKVVAEYKVKCGLADTTHITGLEVIGARFWNAALAAAEKEIEENVSVHEDVVTTADVYTAIEALKEPTP